MNLRFDEPGFLWIALLAIPLAAIGFHALRTADPVRMWTALAARTIVVLTLAIILAGPRLMREHDQLTVIGLLDVSGSVKRFAELPEVPDLGRRTNLEYLQWWLREAARQRDADDRLGVVAFDGRAVALLAPTRAGEFTADVDVAILEGTNIAEAIQLGLAMFPAGTSKRLVLISDGNETVGDALTAAREAGGRTSADDRTSDLSRAIGVPIDVAPVSYRVNRDVQITRIEVPPNARPEQTVIVRIVLEAIRSTPGSLTLLYEGVPLDLNGEQEGFALPIDVPRGESVYAVPVQLAETSVSRFEAIFEPDDPAQDQLVENNRAEAFVATPSRGRVLVVRNEVTGGSATFATTLEASGLPVDVRAPGGVPSDLLELQGYDLIVLQDVAAYEMNPSVHMALARYVRDFGGGLIMLGGESAFGAGGWNGTALEDVLPVELDLPREKRITDAALVLVLDKSGSMTGSVAGSRASQQEVANAGAAMAIESLQPDSLVGVVTFDTVTRTLVELGPNDQPERTAERVRSIIPGGGTNMAPALTLAGDMLRSVDVRRKHIVCLTDGRSRGDEGVLEGLAEALNAEGITISTIAVGDAADSATLEAMAEAGGGEFYMVINPSTLPRILVDSVKVINKPLIKEVPFRPVVQPTGSTLTVGMSAAPILEGLVLTAPRDDPKVSMDMLTPDGDPLLAHWQIGLGRAAAFTSDAHLDWSRHWADWTGYGTFFTQLARTIARSPVSPQFELATRIVDGQLQITLDAMADETAGGGFLDHLVVQGNVYTPSGEQVSVRLRQTAAGQYSGTVAAGESGNYVVALLPRLGNDTLAPVIGGASQRGGVEFRRYRSNIEVLRAIAEETGGRLLDVRDAESAALYDKADLPVSRSLLPVWRGFLYVLVLLFLLDVACRRLAWDSETLQRAWRAAIARVGARDRKAKATQATLASLKQRNEEFEDALERAGRGVEKLEGDGRLRVPRRVQDDRPIPMEDREARITEALDRLKGKSKPATPADKPAPPPKPDDNQGSTETTSDLLRAKRRIRKRLRGEDDREP